MDKHTYNKSLLLFLLLLIPLCKQSSRVDHMLWHASCAFHTCWWERGVISVYISGKDTYAYLFWKTFLCKKRDSRFPVLLQNLENDSFQSAITTSVLWLRLSYTDKFLNFGPLIGPEKGQMCPFVGLAHWSDISPFYWGIFYFCTNCFIPNSSLECLQDTLHFWWGEPREPNRHKGCRNLTELLHAAAV